MLFAGKSGLDEIRDSFFVMNFILMFSWGIIHGLFGGIASLDEQITMGNLDLAMTTPRSPFFILSLSKSSLPAWGDVLLGVCGMAIYSIRFGWIFLFHSILISSFSILALYGFFLFVGSLAFWFRRTEAAHSVLINMCLAFNTYPIHNGNEGGYRWIVFFSPIMLIGVIPASYVLHPGWKILAIEMAGSIFLFYSMRLFFYFGMKRYQSSSVLGLQRQG